uniref:PD-(D/E)XK nuclease family protein n=1 Tax=Alistipes sp. TaxID=1872444 RepID=UPI004056E470
MATFIEEVALQLYEKYGDGLSSLTLLLPSKRARLFFAEALSKVAVTPMWEPEYGSIDDLMCELSGVRKGDKLRLVAELYKVYSLYHEEQFDEFYHWGEVLLSDFDMLDKYMVDASQLFSNIEDIKEIEADLSYLTTGQIELINRFWHTITGEKGFVEGSTVKSRFLKIWRSLGTIYTEFRHNLRAIGIGYTGMIYREAVERLERGDVVLSSGAKYIFIGFNALSKCEQRVLRFMQRNGYVEFYWDYDNYYAENSFQEAGMFIRDNIAQFGETEGVSHDNFCNIHSVNVYSTSSNIAQCQCVVDILEKIAAESGGVLDKDTAVVLTDENLLMPLLYALPEKFKVQREIANGKIKERPLVNVTMGYPLRSTLAYSFVERLLALQKSARVDGTGKITFYYADVDDLLKHPYIATISTSQYSMLRAEIVKHRLFQVPQSMIAKGELLSILFRKAEGWQKLSDYLLEVIDAVAVATDRGDESAYRAEFLAVICDALVKLRNVAEQCDIELSDTIYRSLVRRHLQAERVPFTGEPLQGLQIMGILETRNLDFKNVILLSMTDSNFPGSRATDKSFLPYGLRYGFDIPTAEHHEGVYAYYFYRLVERAENLYMLYSSAADDKSMGEPSRYIRQLEYETDFDIHYSNVGVEVSLSNSDTIKVEKSNEVFDKLLRFTRSKTLSPTAFSTYVNCPLKFYFNNIELLRPENELEETIDSLTFGNIFHEAADKLYSQIQGDAEPAVRLVELREQGEVERCVDSAIAKVYFDREGEPLPELGGELLIIRNIVREYLGKNLINYDIRNRDFVVEATERDINLDVPIEVGDEHYMVKLAGRSDRIDMLKNGMLRVIDYKTGAQHNVYHGIESLFHGEIIAKEREPNVINTLLYAMMLFHTRGRDVCPSLYYVGKMVEDNYSPLLKETINRKSRYIDSYSDIAESFEQEVTATLCEMFDRTKPFSQCEDTSICEYCDYRTVCNRG